LHRKRELQARQYCRTLEALGKSLPLSPVLIEEKPNEILSIGVYAASLTANGSL
jgi:hypothetical protein